MRKQKLLVGMIMSLCMALSLVTFGNMFAFAEDEAVNGNEAANMNEANSAPVIATDSLPEAKVGEEYYTELKYNGGKPDEWELNYEGDGFSFPKGTLGIQDSTGLMFGKAKESGVFKFKITAKNKFGQDSKVYTLKVNPENGALPLPSKYTIKFDVMGGEHMQEPMMTDEEGKLANIPVVFRQDYKFLGWYTEKDGGEQVTVNTIFKSDQTVYARWEKVYDLIVEKGFTDYFKAAAGTKVEIKASKANEGEVFAGWEVIEGGDVKFADKMAADTSFEMPARVVRIRATYKKIDNPVVPPKQVEYKIIKGMNQSWTKGTEGGLEFVSDAPFDSFKAAHVDGKKINNEYITVSEGSTKVFLKPEFLNMLSDGKHMITIESENGKADANFEIIAAKKNNTTGTVEKKNNTTASAEKKNNTLVSASKPMEKAVKPNDKAPAKTPVTGDKSNLLIPLTAIVIAGIAILGLKKSKDK